MAESNNRIMQKTAPARAHFANFCECAIRAAARVLFGLQPKLRQVLSQRLEPICATELLPRLASAMFLQYDRQKFMRHILVAFANFALLKRDFCMLRSGHKRSRQLSVVRAHNAQRSICLKVAHGVNFTLSTVTACTRQERHRHYCLLLSAFFIKRSRHAPDKYFAVAKRTAFSEAFEALLFTM